MYDVVYVGYIISCINAFAKKNKIFLQNGFILEF